MLNIKVFTVNVFQENCFVVSDDTLDAIIIDPGASHPREREAIASYIEEERLHPVAVVATHGHLDHNFGAYDLYERYGLATDVHADDAALLKDINRQVQRFGGLRLGTLPTPVVGRQWMDGDTVQFGNHAFKVLHTPGHTPGGVCLYCAEENLVFAGDTLFANYIGRTDLDGGSLPQLLSSIRTRLFTLPDNTDVLCGHGPSTTIGAERVGNPFLV